MSNSTKQNNKVNINGLMQHFHNVIENQGAAFKPTYIALLYYLFYKNNANFWQDEFNFSKNETCKSCGIRARNTFTDGLKYLSEQVELIKIIYMPNNKYHDYIACFHHNVKAEYFNNYKKNDTEIDPNFAIGYENMGNSTGSKFEQVKNSTGSKFEHVKILPAQILNSTGSKFKPVNENTPYYNNKHKHINNKRDENLKNNENENLKNENQEQKFETNPESDFYRWPVEHIEIYKKNKETFYNHQHRIFDENMRQFKISRPEIENLAAEFWKEIKGTGDWENSFKSLSRHFYYWIRKKQEQNERNNNNSFTANSNTDEARNTRIKKGHSIISQGINELRNGESF